MQKGTKILKNRIYFILLYQLKHKFLQINNQGSCKMLKVEMKEFEIMTGVEEPALWLPEVDE